MIMQHFTEFVMLLSMLMSTVGSDGQGIMLLTEYLFGYHVTSHFGSSYDNSTNNHARYAYDRQA